MQFMGSLYVGTSISSKEHEIVKKVHNKKLVPNLYLITMSANEDNLMDVIPEWEVLQSYYPAESLKVLGIANGKKEALLLVEAIISECMYETGGLKVKEFLKSKWEGQACR